MLGEAIERIEEELSRRENLAIATTTQADLSRHALELKLSRPAPPHPGSGRTASEGMKSKERQKLLRVGPASAGAGERMSALGHKRTLFAAPFDVRFGPESGRVRCRNHVCFVPLADVRYRPFERSFAVAQETRDKEQGTRDKFHCPLQIGVGRGGGAGCLY